MVETFAGCWASAGIGAIKKRMASVRLSNAFSVLHNYLLLENLLYFYKKRTVQGSQRRKAPKGNSESPWSLHMRSFWKITFINPPESFLLILRL